MNITKVLSLTSCVFLASSAFAQQNATPGDSVRIPSGTSAEIDRHGVCRLVSNQNANSLMIPLRSAAEWSVGTRSFLAAQRPGTTVRACPPSTAFENGYRYYPEFYHPNSVTGQEEGDNFGYGIWIHPSGDNFAVGSPLYGDQTSPFNSGSVIKGRIALYSVDQNGVATETDSIVGPSDGSYYGAMIGVSDDMRTIITTRGHILEKNTLGNWVNTFNSAWTFVSGFFGPGPAFPEQVFMSSDGTAAAASVSWSTDSADGVGAAAHLVLLKKVAGSWTEAKLRFLRSQHVPVYFMTRSGVLYVALNEVSGSDISGSLVRKYEYISGNWTMTEEFRPFGASPTPINHLYLTENEGRMVVYSSPFDFDPSAPSPLGAPFNGADVATEPPFIATFDRVAGNFVFRSKQTTDSLGIHGPRPGMGIDPIAVALEYSSANLYGFDPNPEAEISDTGDVMWARALVQDSGRRYASSIKQLRDIDGDGTWEAFSRVVPSDYILEPGEPGYIGDSAIYPYGNFGSYSDIRASADSNRIIISDRGDTTNPNGGSPILLGGSVYLFDFSR